MKVCSKEGIDAPANLNTHNSRLVIVCKPKGPFWTALYYPGQDLSILVLAAARDAALHEQLNHVSGGEKMFPFSPISEGGDSGVFRDDVA